MDRQSPSRPAVEILSLCKDMMPEFKALHKVLFPVQYGEKFYDDVLSADMHVGLVAVVKGQRGDDTSGSSVGGVTQDGGGRGDNQEHEKSNTAARHSEERRGGCTTIIVGVASGRVKSVPGIWRDSRDGYIMTLGTHEAYRGQGIANRLLKALMQELSKRYNAETFSLHCTTDNTAAIALYQKNLFAVTQKLVAHYHFHGKHHDAFELILKSRGGKSSCSCHVM